MACKDDQACEEGGVWALCLKRRGRGAAENETHRIGPEVYAGGQQDEEVIIKVE